MTVQRQLLARGVRLCKSLVHQVRVAVCTQRIKTMLVTADSAMNVDYQLDQLQISFNIGGWSCQLLLWWAIRTPLFLLHCAVCGRVELVNEVVYV